MHTCVRFANNKSLLLILAVVVALITFSIEQEEFKLSLHCSVISRWWRGQRLQWDTGGHWVNMHAWSWWCALILDIGCVYTRIHLTHIVRIRDVTNLMTWIEWISLKGIEIYWSNNKKKKKKRNYLIGDYYRLFSDYSGKRTDTWWMGKIFANYCAKRLPRYFARNSDT